jgi:hypothetical protein
MISDGGGVHEATPAFSCLTADEIYQAYGIRLPQHLAQDLAEDLVPFDRDLEAAFAAARRARLDQPMRRACRGPSA